MVDTAWFGKIGAFEFDEEGAGGKGPAFEVDCLVAWCACVSFDCAPARGATPSEVLASRVTPGTPSAKRTGFYDDERLSRVSLA